MAGSYSTFLLKAPPYLLLSITFIFFTVLVLLSVFIIGCTIYKRNKEVSKNKWQQSIAEIISQAIFFANKDDEPVEITYKIEMLLQKAAFRDCIINELIRAKKNISGASTVNLKRLYEILELDREALKKLESSKWHTKAKGIQELEMMEQIKYVKQIFRLTNNENEFVRNQAQCALVAFYGFLGLRFLSVTAKPISQWQQIQLLNKLNDVQPANMDVITKWLQSPNESVRVFAIKLAVFFNCYNMHDNIVKCLENTNLQVRLCALEYLKKFPQHNTADHIIAYYRYENKIYKLAVIDALKDIGCEKQIPFLLKQLHDNDDNIKATAAKSLALLHPAGAEFLQTHLFADEDPWKAIFLYIKNERAA